MKCYFSKEELRCSIKLYLFKCMWIYAINRIFHVERIKSTNDTSSHGNKNTEITLIKIPLCIARQKRYFDPRYTLMVMIPEIKPRAMLLKYYFEGIETDHRLFLNQRIFWNLQ